MKFCYKLKSTRKGAWKPTQSFENLTHWRVGAPRDLFLLVIRNTQIAVEASVFFASTVIHPLIIDFYSLTQL